ncbi:hypothetical protein NIE88_08715 [Sporolactobacillus shoreicorticis]|uniref:Uncharacterized protein n=1 Tax=Sporolactobacillus shoreicorticis TaxID=1923877 RepID=A0ABW5S486_9BACL|nr:hypothetical protein [Sporolactobacillus shoreicorticis]MCO7125852.1 hypothetical protein [Sporolactobacillus shoreicorticis]
MKQTDKGILFFTVPVAVLMVTTSCFGILCSDVYAKETISWYAQTIGQDLSNLLVVVPLLLFSSFFASKGNKVGIFVWLGTMITNIYSFVIYCFAIHFNFLFLFYCAILGLSIYSVLYFFYRNKKVSFKSWFKNHAPVKSVSSFLIVIASVFALLWLSDSLPEIVTNKTPESITEAGLLSNPVHVLDFSFYLPFMVLSGVFLMKKRSIGYILAPPMILFAGMTAMNIIALMAASMWILRENTWPQMIIFSTVAWICFFFFALMLRQLKNEEKHTI